MDTYALLDCCLAVPSSHSFPGVPGRSQPLHHSIVLLPALQVLLAYLGKIPPPAKLLTWLLLGLCLIQTEVFAMIRTAVPTLAAFHPVLALVLFALALTIAWRARTVVRAPAATQPTPVKQSTSGTLAGTREPGI